MMVWKTLAVLFWLAFCQVAKCSVITGGQDSERWASFNEANEIPPGNPWTGEDGVPHKGVFTFQTQDHQMFFAYPVGNRGARQSFNISSLLNTTGTNPLSSVSGIVCPLLSPLFGVLQIFNSFLGFLFPDLVKQFSGILNLICPGSARSFVGPSDGLQLLGLMGLLNQLQGLDGDEPTSRLGPRYALQLVKPCPVTCTVSGVKNALSDLTEACNTWCIRGLYPASGQPKLSTCLEACARPTREACVALCGSGPNDPSVAACVKACNFLCPASVTPNLQLTDLTCCVIPPAICGYKGPQETQVENCQRSCTTFFSGVHADLTSCQEACTNVPAESCRVECADGFSNRTEQLLCTAACGSLCNLTTEVVSYQTGVSLPSLRAFCPERSLPVCRLSVGSSAYGLTRVAQQSNCLKSCTKSAFSSVANLNRCIRACALVPQVSCVTVCSAASTQQDADLCEAACDSLCP